MPTGAHSNLDEDAQHSTRQRICRQIDALIKRVHANAKDQAAPDWQKVVGLLYSMRTEENAPALPFFDASWYATTYSIPTASPLDAFEHYVTQGSALGYSPGPDFHAKAYLLNYPDVAAVLHDPLIHFLLHGAREGRQFFVHVEAEAPVVPDGDIRVPLPVDPDHLARLQDPWTPAKAEALLRALGRCDSKPCMSVLMPVYHPDLRHLKAAVDSVRAQIYEDWQLCIADDATGSEELARYLAELGHDPRIRITIRPARGHISAATNTAAETALGAFFLLLDQDDQLSPDALARCVLAINSRPDVDYIYSDSDKIGDDGRHFAMERKPAFSPELLLNYMYAGHALCVRATLWRELGGLRRGFEGSQDHDFALRATEMARVVLHVPEVLYHWRAATGSTALDGHAKPYSFAAGQRAVQEALDRRNIPAQAIRTDWAIAHHLAAFDAVFPDEGPSVGIVIPTRNGLDLIRGCIESLRRTTYRNFRVLVVDNHSDAPDVVAYLASLPGAEPFPVEVVRIANPHGSFNFSHLVNRGVALLDTDFAVLLNNDTAVISPQWLSTLVGYGQLPGVGAVGCMLLYPNGRIQHGGVFVSDQPHLFAGHLAKGTLPESGSIRSAFNVAAVTAACMLVPRQTYLEIGGFDETQFAVAYNDVDFCLRLGLAGKRVVMATRVQLYHFEGRSRGYLDNPAELGALNARHGPLHDPYLSPHLRVAEVPRRMPRRLALAGDRPTRILAVTHNLNREGAPIAFFEACAYMVETYGASITVQSSQDGPLREAFVQAGMQVEISLPPWLGGNSASAYEDETLLAGRQLRQDGFDLVIANTLLSFHAVDAAHGAGIPSVWWIHENDGHEGHFSGLNSGIRHRAMACFGHSYRTLFVAAATMRKYANLNYHHNAVVIPGGIAASWAAALDGPMREAACARLGLGPEHVLVLSLGTICARKRQRDVLAGFATTAAANPNLVLLMAGPEEPTYAEALKADVAALEPGLRARVMILPSTGEVQPLYAAADIFVLASEDESYPRTILEAMAAGLPVLACPVGGIEEQVRPGVNAEFFAPGDIGALARLLERFSAEPETRLRYGNASRLVSQSLNTAERASDALWAILCEAVLTSPPPSRLAQFQGQAPA